MTGYRAGNGYQPTKGNRCAPPNCGSAVQRPDETVAYRLKKTYDLGYDHGRAHAVREFVDKLRAADDGTGGTYIMREKINKIADEFAAEIKEEK